MSKWPWQSLDPVDGGAPRKVQRGKNPVRGLKAARARAAGVVTEKPMPNWMKKDIADVTSAMGGVHPGQAQETDDKDVPDTRTPLERKYDIREIDGRRVAHVTPEKFRDIAISTGGLKRFRQEVSKIVISDGVNVSAEFKFANAYPARLNVDARLMSTELVRHGIVGALGSDRVALILDGQRKELGYLVRGDVSPELAAHGQLVSDSHLQSVTRHVTGGTRYGGNFTTIFSSAVTLKDALKRSPEGIVVKIGEMRNDRRKTLFLGCVFPCTDSRSPDCYIHHASVVEFRERLMWRFAAVAGANPFTVTDINGTQGPITDVKGVVLYPRVHQTAGPLGEPVGVFIPAAYLPPSLQSPDPTL